MSSRELITIQIGQCGNQIGCRFWDTALKEHTVYSKKVFDDSMASFFRNLDEEGSSLPLNSKVSHLRARAVLVDMEESVVNHYTQRSVLGSLFDPDTQCITANSGSGNNWAHGFCHYGPAYSDVIEESVRKQAEMCESLQSFFLIHSMGGGTGSGLGTYILNMLEDRFPDVYRFVNAVFPSADDDVVTSPYNSVLAMRQLIEHADCVLPVENTALARLASSSGMINPDGKKSEAFEAMNTIAANLLTHLTSSMRFPGKLNIDLNEITMNLVPYPRLHFLIPSLSPVISSAPKNVPVQTAAPRHVNQMFTDAFNKESQLVECNPRSFKYLACGLLVRGNVEVSDINNNIMRLRPELTFAHWNSDGFKIGLCSFPPVAPKVPYSLLTLSNNCCMAEIGDRMLSRFNKLFKRKVYLHHYEEYAGEGDDTKTLFRDSAGALQDIVQEWTRIQREEPPSEEQLDASRLMPDF
eukprot:ANDGO_06301.mRNA.1 Tubulin beta-2 chain